MLIPIPSPSSFPLASAGISTAGGPPGVDRLVLEPGESVVASCRFDLNASLHFSYGLMVLTDRRLLADTPASADEKADFRQPATSPAQWSSLLDSQTHIHVSMRAAVGRLKLTHHDRVIARWMKDIPVNGTSSTIYRLMRDS